MTAVHRAAPVVALALVALLGACSQEKRGGQPLQPADEPEAAEHPTGVSASEGYQAHGAAVKPGDIAEAPAPAASTNFTCDGGRSVAISNGAAVVTLEDGRTVRIGRDPRDPAHFQGEALGFRMKDGQGELSQDEGGTVHCTGG